MATANKSKNLKQPDKKAVNNFMVFKKQNYMLLLASLAVIIIGFMVMGLAGGEAFDDPMKITVAPLIVLFGFALGVFSILYTPKDQNKEAGSQDNH
jgi:formate/nitrite transporter FocA (FNT family)